MIRPLIGVPLLFIAFLLITSVGNNTSAAPPRALPAGFTRVTVATGLVQPTTMAFHAGRIFVTEKWTGRVMIVRKDGTLRPTPYVTVNVDSSVERGLLGIAFDPNYASNHFVYLYYTTGPGALNYRGTPMNRVSRFMTVHGVGTQETIIMDNIPSDDASHNGGDIHFGFDGKLYIAVGDGGSYPDAAHKLWTRRGKILRVNPDGTIPTDNPYYNRRGAAKSVYARGFRNPWRFTLRRSNQTYLVGDVGWNTWEELDSLQAGGDYGWNEFEGPCPASALDCDPAETDYAKGIQPIHSYNHTVGHTIIAGAFAENSNYPTGYAGQYFYGDYTAGWVHVLNMDSNNAVLSELPFDEALNAPVDFEQGPDGNIYVLTIYEGAIYKYVYSPS